MRRDWLLAGGAIVVLALLGWAWNDGGERPLRPISQAVTLPGAAQ